MNISPIINNIKYYIKNENDHIQKYLLEGKQWNSEIIEIIKNYINKYNLQHFVNIGSHIGTVSLPISLYINNVTAIEAYPPTYNYLCENIELNNITNINTINIAVGNKDDIIYFMSEEKVCPIENVNRISENSGGMHVFTELDIEHNIRSANLTDKKIQGQMKKFNDLNINKFDIMLVDIEGFEYYFLQGAKETLLKYKPIIIIEIWDNNKRKKENMKTTREFIIDYIKQLNYKLVNVIDDDHIFEPN